MKQYCRICQQMFDYCPSCAIIKNPFKKAGYCDENCYHISMILQRYGSKLLTATETIKALEPYNIDQKSLQPSIDEYYQKIIKEAEAQKPKRKIKHIAEVVPEENVEVVIENAEDAATSIEK